MAGFRRVFAGVLLAAGTLGTGAHAQTIIDAGKTAPQLFASDCAPCHKSPQGLYKGALGLQSFLREHYTSSRETAAILADYLGKVGDGKPAPAAQRRREAKPPADGTAAKPSAKKDGKGDGKTDAKSDSKSDAKADSKPADAKPADAKPAEAKPVDAKPAETKPAEAKPAAESKPAETPVAKPAE